MSSRTNYSDSIFKKHFKIIFVTIFVLIFVFSLATYSFGIKEVLAFVLSIFVAIILNPVFWVSVLGPFIQSFHFLWLRSKLGIGYKAKEVGELPEDLKKEENEIEKLRETLNENKLAYALSDFNTQLFVTSVAFIFLSINIVTVVINFYMKSNGEVVQKVLINDVFSLIVLIFFLIFFVLGIYVLLSGKLISIKVLKYYKPDGDITGETRFPPIQSGLTKFRYAITIYSVFYSMWINEQVPKLLEYMKV